VNSLFETKPAATVPDSGFESRLASYRGRVKQLILGSIPEREPQKHLYSIVSSLLSNEGKGIRPALCLATCRAFDGDEARALPAAAAIELLHNAFLVHDDVEDESDFRRGLPTLHKRYGVPLAVNVGDAMNAMGIRILRQNLPQLGPELSGRVFDEFDHLSIETIEGQAMELGWIRDNDCATTEDDYLLMVLKKTAWYSFIHPMRIGALIADPHRIDFDAFNRFGCFLGTAFQIQDDVLNLTGDPQKYGKEIGGDLLEGKRTLILTHLFANSELHERQRLKAFLGKARTQRLPRELAWVQDLVRSRGSIEYARQAARQFAEGARREFDVAYAGATPGQAVDFVKSLLEYMVSRDK
jgi:geranylgeranyl pyrophosphate synthase